MKNRYPRVLIVADHASNSFGGEAILPLHYFRVLLSRNAPVWMIVHERSKPELERLPELAKSRIRFVPDTVVHRGLWQAGRHLPRRLDVATLNYMSHVLTQCIAREYATDMVRKEGIEVVHQPIPVSPKEPSVLFDLGAPLVIGPMNGGMSYPAGFGNLEGKVNRMAMQLGRSAANQLNRLIPGKHRAAVLVVANARTRRALPSAVSASIVELSENSVDSRFGASGAPHPAPAASPDSFLPVAWLLTRQWIVCIHAFRAVLERHDAELRIIGDGPLRSELERLAPRPRPRAPRAFHRVAHPGRAGRAALALRGAGTTELDGMWRGRGARGHGLGNSGHRHRVGRTAGLPGSVVWISRRTDRPPRR